MEPVYHNDTTSGERAVWSSLPIERTHSYFTGQTRSCRVVNTPHTVSALEIAGVSRNTSSFDPPAVSATWQGSPKVAESLPWEGTSPTPWHRAGPSVVCVLCQVNTPVSAYLFIRWRNTSWDISMAMWKIQRQSKCKSHPEHFMVLDCGCNFSNKKI